MGYIYTLSDPRTHIVMYVGKTILPLQERLRCHLKDKYGCVRVNWIKELLQLNLVPIIDSIEQCNEEDLNWLECYWIEQFKHWGFDLLNRTSGGDGTRLSEETKQKISDKNSRLDAQQKLELIELYSSRKYTQQQIGDMFGISRKAIDYNLKKLGIKPERVFLGLNDKQLAALALARTKESFTPERRRKISLATTRYHKNQNLF